jgi:hypothetical protein
MPEVITTLTGCLSKLEPEKQETGSAGNLKSILFQTVSRFCLQKPISFL